jgi:hypothetical protein
MLRLSLAALRRQHFVPMFPRIFAFLAAAFFPLAALAQNAGAGEAEAQRCEERAAAAKRDVLNKYEDALADLQTTLQKSADLEGAVAVRNERKRVAADQTLAESNYVAEPKALRALQVQTAEKIQDLLAQLVAETLPKLVELKRQLTIAGKLDEAIAIRASIEKLQNTYLPASRIESGASVTSETIVLAYAADRARADKIYKGQRFSVRGVVGGFRVDPGEPRNYQVFLAGGGSAGWVQCTFAGGDHRFREEKGAYNLPVLVIADKDGDAVRVQKGTAIEVRGICEGWEDAVRIAKCEIAR